MTGKKRLRFDFQCQYKDMVEHDRYIGLPIYIGRYQGRPIYRIGNYSPINIGKQKQNKSGK